MEQIKIEYRNFKTGEILPVYIDVFHSSLAEKWLASLNYLLKNNYHLEKNYCFMGWIENDRNKYSPNLPLKTGITVNKVHGNETSINKIKLLNKIFKLVIET